MVLHCINIRQVPCEVLKTAAFGLGFQHLPLAWRMIMHEKPCLISIMVMVRTGGNQGNYHEITLKLISSRATSATSRGVVTTYKIW